MEICSTVAQPESHLVGCQLVCRLLDHGWKLGQTLQKLQFRSGIQGAGICLADALKPDSGLSQYGINSGVGILNIVDRAFLATRQRQIDSKYKRGVCPSRHQEKTYRIPAHPVDELAHGDITACAFGNGDLLALTHDLDHAMQDISRKILWNAQVQSLQSGTHPGDCAVVIGALDIDAVMKTALPLGDMIGDIRHKVGIVTITFTHDPVFVITRTQLSGT